MAERWSLRQILFSVELRNKITLLKSNKFILNKTFKYSTKHKHSVECQAPLTTFIWISL